MQLHGFTKTAICNLAVDEKTTELMSKTTTQYRDVVTFYLRFFQENQYVADSEQWLLLSEHKTHRTKSNPSPLYDFDAQFSNYPSGFRRAAIAEAYGAFKSWSSNYENWQNRKNKNEEKNKKRIENNKKPILFKEHPPQYPDVSLSWLNYYSTTYKIIDNHHILLKLFTGKSYIYKKIPLYQQMKVPNNYKAGSPTLLKTKDDLWQLHIPMVTSKKNGIQKIVKTIEDPNYKICTIDLGINNHFVATIQDAEGRVLATKFLSGKRDSRLRKTYLEKVARLQRITKTIPENETFAKDLWNKISNFNDNLAHKVSRELVNFAKENGAKILVFEYLENLKPEKGTKSHWLNQKLGYWLKARIFKYAQYKALHEAIVSSRVSPRDTSSICPYCGLKTIERYSGVSQAKCTNCGTKDVSADFIANYNIGNKFRNRHIT